MLPADAPQTQNGIFYKLPVFSRIRADHAPWSNAGGCEGGSFTGEKYTAPARSPGSRFSSVPHKRRGWLLDCSLTFYPIILRHLLVCGVDSEQP